MLSNKQKIEIEIDDDNQTYRATINYVNLSTLESILKDLVSKIESKEILIEPEIEAYPTDNN